MAAHRTIRIARVEYQPNQQQPVSPVPLGVVVEEILESRRHVIIVGCEPGGAVPGLQLEDAWGPFKTIVTEWVQVLARTLREGFDSVTLPDYTIDKVGSRWLVRYDSYSMRAWLEPSFPSPAPWMFADRMYGLGNCLIDRDGRVIGAKPRELTDEMWGV
jgi:hypothetical protein